FSSRRRHTRSKRDWSSDVCSSDLAEDEDDDHDLEQRESLASPHRTTWFSVKIGTSTATTRSSTTAPMTTIRIGSSSAVAADTARSEERRVGKEWKGRRLRADSEEK